MLALINTAQEIGEKDPLHASQAGITGILAQTNPRFDAQRFWQAVEKKTLENRAITK